ncbi:MAG: MBL fold metallo-hydrolase [Fluviibacter sp.]|jgi:glyoxylase-like metal-dependent hydrolase (beta-lactamase superfamily II)
MNPTIEPFFDPDTWTVSYIVYEAPGTACAIIDSVLDYDPKSGCTSTHAADTLIAFVRKNQLKVEWILETHAHADHLTAAPYIKDALGGKIAIGEKITTVQGVFKTIFNLGPQFAVDGSQFDHLFADGEQFQIGKLTCEVLSLPGHTPACVGYKIGDAVFVGDTIAMPDVGTARCDFPGGDAARLFKSVQTLLSLPPETRLFMCHDYPPGGREVCVETTVAEERTKNIHVHDGVDEAAYVAMRQTRDQTLAMPVLMLPAVQINIRAGYFPPAEDNGVSYVKIPLNAL